ncbi:PIG-L domain-containing protein [Gammaproteobacteria bacterium 42_54_T18]|nr:PIG-L domain-containing protein [Gammaproteobacteria bacterium 42_54_T18]
MISMKTLLGDGHPLKILALGAHCDDIEIGCGGSILSLIENYNIESIHWVVFSSNDIRKIEALQSAESFLSGVKNTKIIIKDFRNGYFPYIGADIKDYFETIKNDFEPNLILTHYRNDRHQDHRTISDLTWNTFRNHLIFEYEIPKYDGDISNPNFFINVSKKNKNLKIETLLKHFPSQANKQWFTQETFEAIMRLRGIESNAPESYAEAFYARKLAI